MQPLESNFCRTLNALQKPAAPSPLPPCISPLISVEHEYQISHSHRDSVPLINNLGANTHYSLSSAIVGIVTRGSFAMEEE